MTLKIPKSCQEFVFQTVVELVELRSGTYTVVRPDGSFRKKAMPVEDWELYGCRDGKTGPILQFQGREDCRIEVRAADLHKHCVFAKEVMACLINGDMTGGYTPLNPTNPNKVKKPVESVESVASFDGYDPALAGIF